MVKKLLKWKIPLPDVLVRIIIFILILYGIAWWWVGGDFTP